MNEWRTIDTEPKDGTVITLLIPFDDPYPTHGKWDKVLNCYMYEGCDGPDDIQPTHWMPFRELTDD